MNSGKQEMSIFDLIPDHIRTIIPYEPGKPIEEVERELGIKNSIKLASNENPLGPSRAAIEKAKQFLNTTNLYPDGSGYYLRQKLVQKIGRGITADHIILGCGSSELIELIGRILLTQKDEAVYADPSFVMYGLSVQYANAIAVKVPCKNHTHDLAAILEKITPNTKLVYIANPNNPTGTIVERDEFTMFMKELPNHVVVVVDEAYREYILEEKFPDVLPYVLNGEKVVILRTFSKIYGLAGFRVGYGIAIPDIIKQIHKIRQPFNINTLGQVAAIAALDDDEHVRKSVQVNEAGKHYLYEQFKQLPIKFTHTYANFIMVELKENSRDFYQRLLKRGVIVRPIGGYGLTNALRITIGTESENKRLIEAMRAELAS